MEETGKRRGFTSLSRFSLVLTLLTLLVLACGLSVSGNGGAQQTQAAVSLQATIQAQEATQAALEQQNAQIAIQATQAALDRLKTEIASQATMAAIQITQPPTENETPPTQTPQLSPTVAEPEAVFLTEFSGSGWSFVKSAQCKDRQKGCWLGTVKKTQVTTLTGKEQVFLDPAWTFPHLVFWTRYKGFYGFTFGYVELDVQGQVGYARVQSFGGTKDYWERVYIPLQDYVGNTVAVRFYFQGPDGTSPYQPSTFTWIIEDIQITPNFPQ
ncbi:MAG: hypothetical protein Kow0088_19820 [Anaerolineales bacterium]